ncbi:MAG: hypothetical protein ACLPN1_03155 [Dissulfurispiraceae bacterium]|jgi:hypothetical protein
MIISRAISILAIICIMLCYPGISCAVTLSGKGALQTPTQGAGTSSASGSTVSRFTTFVKTMDGDTLVTTDNKQYDLSGVTVITKSDNHTTGSKAVEMVFINGTLNQVIVH